MTFILCFLQAWKKEAAMESEPLHSAAKILERMGVQNYSADIVLDFKVMLLPTQLQCNSTALTFILCAL